MTPTECTLVGTSFFLEVILLGTFSIPAQVHIFPYEASSDFQSFYSLPAIMKCHTRITPTTTYQKKTTPTTNSSSFSALARILPFCISRQPSSYPAISFLFFSAHRRSASNYQPLPKNQKGNLEDMHYACTTNCKVNIKGMV